LEARLPVDCEPLTGLLPDQAPDATQEVAFVAVQVSEDFAPFAIVLGVAPRLTTGASEFTDTAAD
jgi:hypothetical protein